MDEELAGVLMTLSESDVQPCALYVVGALIEARESIARLGAGRLHIHCVPSSRRQGVPNTFPKPCVAASRRYCSLKRGRNDRMMRGSPMEVRQWVHNMGKSLGMFQIPLIVGSVNECTLGS